MSDYLLADLLADRRLSTRRLSTRRAAFLLTLISVGICLGLLFVLAVFPKTDTLSSSVDA